MDSDGFVCGCGVEVAVPEAEPLVVVKCGSCQVEWQYVDQQWRPWEGGQPPMDWLSRGNWERNIG